MQLFYSPTSPFVRKVLLCAHELGLNDRISHLPADPWKQPAELLALNPLSKIPALLTDNSDALFDSPVICEYLDSLAGGILFPTGAARWPALRLQALADGMLDAAVLRRMESLRPVAKQSTDWLELQRQAVARGVDTLESNPAWLESPLDIGQIAAACALGYLDFRFAHEDWRPTHPRLAAWHAVFSRRPSYTLTAPPSA
jgi:glutathione S-transferase